MPVSAEVKKAAYRTRTNEVLVEVELSFDDPIDGTPRTSLLRVSYGSIPRDAGQRAARIAEIRADVRDKIRDLLRGLEAQSDISDPSFEGEVITLS